MSTHPFKVGDRVSAPDGYFADDTSRPHREGIICSLYGEHQTPQVRFDDRPDVLETVAAAALCLIGTHTIDRPDPLLTTVQPFCGGMCEVQVHVVLEGAELLVNHEHLGSPMCFIGPCAVIVSANEQTAVARKIPLADPYLWNMIREHMVAKHQVQS